MSRRRLVALSLASLLAVPAWSLAADTGGGPGTIGAGNGTTGLGAGTTGTGVPAGVPTAPAPGTVGMPGTPQAGGADRPTRPHDGRPTDDEGGTHGRE
jgi:hypothetical protein